MQTRDKISRHCNYNFLVNCSAKYIPYNAVNKKHHQVNNPLNLSSVATRLLYLPRLAYFRLDLRHCLLYESLFVKVDSRQLLTQYETKKYCWSRRRTWKKLLLVLVDAWYRVSPFAEHSSAISAGSFFYIKWRTLNFGARRLRETE